MCRSCRLFGCVFEFHEFTPTDKLDRLIHQALCVFVLVEITLKYLTNNNPPFP